MKLLDYIFFRLYDYFLKKEKDFVMTNTLMMILAIELSLLLFIYYSTLLFVDSNPIRDFIQNNRDKKFLIIGVSMCLTMIPNYIYFSPKREKKYYEGLKKKYYREKYKTHIWVIFGAPIYITLISTIGYGLIKGTLRFPLFEKILNSF